MASHPDIPPPDRINPQAPPETPPVDPGREHPHDAPPEIVPETPNIDEPARGPDEAPSPKESGCGQA